MAYPQIPLLPGRYYHLYNRGNNSENVFIEERNYTYFLEQYSKHVVPFVDTYAYCLLRNHFHFLIRVKTESDLKREFTNHRSERLEHSERYERCKTNDDLQKAVARGIQSWFGTYAMAINKAYKRTGKLFQEHFGRIEVYSDQYFTNLIAYIHFNPQKHGFVDDFREWAWSSYGALASPSKTTLKREAVLNWFEGEALFRSFHLNAIDERLIAPLIGDDFD